MLWSANPGRWPDSYYSAHGPGRLLWDDGGKDGGDHIVRWLLQLGPAHVAEVPMTDVTLHRPPAPLPALLAALDQTRIRSQLARLCAADIAGRRIGTDGHDQAAEWIATTMRSLDLAVEPFEFILEIPVLHLTAALYAWAALD